ncbi:MAG: TIGR03000 domain-containing protein [Thermoguttaceae bacterium]|nr:TIGR03000 domain-containing protein [Thermoguttaceae bacterium]
MKFNVKFALRCVAVVATVAVASNAFAADGLLGSGLFKGLVPSRSAAVSDDFFAGEAITFGDMSYSAYASSAIDGSYGECASCAGQAESVDDGYYVDYGYPVAYDYGYADEYGWAPASGGPVRNFLRAPVRTALRVPEAVLRGVRNFLFGSFDYCRPAYVCDPCWTVCDDCCYGDWSPCAVDACDPCAPMACAPACGPCDPAVYAPRSCCGNGYAPGETHPLDPATGLQEGAKSDQEPASAVSTDDLDSDSPAVPAAEMNDEDQSRPIDTFNSAPEEDPTNDSSSFIKMLVPEDSVVYVNGYRTKQKGALRTFAARNLEFGETYEFEIRVVAVRNGKTFEDVQTTTLTAGDSTSMAFNLTLRDNEAYAYSK